MSSDAPRRNRHQEDLEATIWDDCNRATSDLTAAQLALANFDERARTQGVPPGWLR